jgi:hypothetical protein
MPSRSCSDEKGVIQKDAEVTVGGIPATVAIRSQIIPFKIMSMVRGKGEGRICRPYLFPKEASNTKCATAVSEHAKQSNEHSDK